MYKLRIDNTTTDLSVSRDCATLHSASLAFIQVIAQCLIEDEAYTIRVMDCKYTIVWEARV